MRPGATGKKCLCAKFVAPKPQSMYKQLVLLFILISFSVTGQISERAKPLAEMSVNRRYVERAMVYPEQALKNGIKGKVVVSFDVLPDGTTTNFAVDRSVDPQIDAEALRLSTHILWKPAQFAGKPVASRETLTLEFNPKSYKKRQEPNEIHSITRLADGLKQTPDPVFQLRQLNQSPQAILPEGFKSLNAYIIHLMKYPEMAARNNISGTVVLDFVIETNGLASNIRLRESVGGGCDQEAIRILELLRWQPGIKDGQPVRTHADLEIIFRLSEHSQKAIPNQRNTGL